MADDTPIAASIAIPAEVPNILAQVSLFLKGRCTWRHDSVEQSLYNLISIHLDESITIYADLDYHHIDDNPSATSTIYGYITKTGHGYCLSESTRTVNILELTVPTNKPEGLSNARSLKQFTVQ